MPKAILIVQSAPASPDSEAEYNEWYDTVHLADVCAIPGVTGAKRYKLSDANPLGNAEGALPYIAIYEIESDDLTATLNELPARSMDGRMQMSDVLGMDPMPVLSLYELHEG